MRVGLFGGTFNPIHNGHLMVAEQVLRRLRLDRLYLIPCRVPPHKHPAYLAPAEHRLRMIQLALPMDDRYLLSDVEIARTGPSYTIDTVDHFQTRLLPQATLFLVMGLDAFLEIHTWKDQRRLLKAVQPAVVTRRLGDPRQWSDDADRMDGYIRSRLSGDYRFDPRQGSWCRGTGQWIHLLTTAPVEISSSQVRWRIRQGRAIGDLVPATVAAYIERKELYR